MAEENPNTMNLDLNLGIYDNPSADDEPGFGPHPNVATYLNELLGDPVQRFREEVRQRNQSWLALMRQLPLPPEALNIAQEFFGGNEQQTADGSVSTEEHPNELAKTCENPSGGGEDDALIKKDDAGKNNGGDCSFFDCSICLDLAKDPVVTCCGHLFCWPCLYLWLHHHSYAKECPVCKGEVAVENVTPIYGRDDNKREPNVDCNVKVPPRPQAQRVESLRQANQMTTGFSTPIHEVIRRHGNTYDLDQGLAQIQTQNSDSPQESPERSNSMLNRILPSRGMRGGQPPALVLDPSLLIMEHTPPNYDARDNRRPSSMLLARGNSPRGVTLANHTLGINSAESLAAETVESYFHIIPEERSQEMPPPFDDRDSISSILAAIHSESQTVDNAVEIDSTVALTNSFDASRILDMDSGDSSRPRRRRLN